MRVELPRTSAMSLRERGKGAMWGCCVRGHPWMLWGRGGTHMCVHDT